MYEPGGWRGAAAPDSGKTIILGAKA